MSIQITPDEDRAALSEMIARTRHLLAVNRRTLRLHRDIYQSPKEQLDAIEAEGAKYLAAVEALEADREKISAPHTSGVRASA